MVDLADQGETAVGEALDDPQLPQRTSAVELLGHESSDEVLELLVRSRGGKRRVPHVVVEVEVLVVDPHRMPLERDGRQSLPVSRDLVEARGDEGADRGDVHPVR